MPRVPNQLRRPGHPASIASLSSDHASAIFATDSSMYVFCHLFVLASSDDVDDCFLEPFWDTTGKSHRQPFWLDCGELCTCSSHDQLKNADGSLDSLDRILELVLVPATRMSTSLYSVCVNRLRSSLNFAGVLRIPKQTVPSNRSAARMSKQSKTMTPSTRDPLTKRACTSFLPPLSITLSSESDSDEHRLPVLEKHDPTWAPRDLPNPSLIASTPMPKDKSDYEARFDALKHEVEQASQTIVSRHVEESDRRLHEEWLRKRTPVPSVVITNVGGESGARVAEKSPLGVKVSRRETLAVLPVVPESSSDCEDGLEENNATEDVPDDMFTKLE